MNQTWNRPKRPDTLLRLDGLRVDLQRTHGPTTLVKDATFEVRAGEIVCLVGESGSGKSLTARAIMGLTRLDPRISASGSVRFDTDDLMALDDRALRGLRGSDITMVFQEPLSSLDPVYTVGSQLREGLRRRERLTRSAARARILDALVEVGIHDGDRVVRSFPHQLSGGMCQRVMIAMALLTKPRLLIADEPTTALDVTVQAQILELIDRLRRDTGMAVLLVTHDMGVAANIADRIVVMYAGRVVEDSDPRILFDAAHHPYSSGLLMSVAPMTGRRPHWLPTIGGAVPDPSARPDGCAFHPRCPARSDRCSSEEPPLSPAPRQDSASSGSVACWHPISPGGDPLWGAAADVESTTAEASR